jgi:hypothetical protein
MIYLNEVHYLFQNIYNIMKNRNKFRVFFFIPFN